MKVVAIARLTIAEAVHRRLVLTGTVVALGVVGLFVAAFWFLASGTSGPGGPLSSLAFTVLTIVGLAMVSVLTGAMAVVLAAGAISNDMDSGVLHAVLARPLSRAQYVWGRWAGLAALVAGFVTVMASALLTASWAFAGSVALDPVATVALLVLQATVLLSLALLGSTLLPTMATTVAVLGLFGLAWLGGIVGTIGRSIGNDGVVAATTAVSLAMPSDTVWRAASYFAQSSALLSAGEVPGIPFASAAPPPTALLTWAVVYPLVTVGLAVLVFSRRDL